MNVRGRFNSFTENRRFVRWWRDPRARTIPFGRANQARKSERRRKMRSSMARVFVICALGLIGGMAVSEDALACGRRCANVAPAGQTPCLRCIEDPSSTANCANSAGACGCFFRSAVSLRSLCRRKTPRWRASSPTAPSLRSARPCRKRSRRCNSPTSSNEPGAEIRARCVSALRTALSVSGRRARLGCEVTRDGAAEGQPRDSDVR